ncbi:MAG: glycosyltransferase family 2 protein [Desulfuromonadaceae bacterium]|nr:glycosyltransferase family 2 protein [Desulfuromonadaceae bacterium]NLV24095.1 glycosyltransferase family 2 protein [Deltaproteobacteria bacterium]
MISAIIVNYHSHLLTARAAASLLADMPGLQVLVVDNSADSAETEKLKTVLPSPVECLVAEENLGFGKGCNLAFSRARHELVFLLNPDAYVLPGCLPRLQAFMEQNPRAGAVAPLVFWDREKQWLLPPYQAPGPSVDFVMSCALRWPWLGGKVSHRVRRQILHHCTSEAPFARTMLSGGHLMLRRAAVEAAGGLFDERFFMYFEDADLSRRLGRAGYHLYVQPAAHAVHEWLADPGKNPLVEAGQRIFLSKHHSRSCFPLMGKILERVFPSPQLPASRDLEIHSPFLPIPLPRGEKGPWIVEISPHPLFVPAAYCLKMVEGGGLAGGLVPRLGPGDYWLRIGTAEAVVPPTYRLRIEKREIHD